MLKFQMTEPSNEGLFNYQAFNDLKIGQIKLNLIEDKHSDYIKQGLNFHDDYMCISLYSTQDNKTRTIIYVKDIYGNEKCINLKCGSHAGAIDYHEIDGKGYYFVSCGKTIAVYNANKIVNTKDNIWVDYDYKIYLANSNKDGKCINCNGSEIPPKDYNTYQTSYFTFDNDKLYVGYCDSKGNGNGILREYSLKLEYDAENNITAIKATYERKWDDTLNYLQGLTFFYKNGKKYAIFSSSKNRKQDGYLHVYEMNNDNNMDYIGSIATYSMVEQICVTNEGNIGLVYESSAKKYQNFLNPAKTNIPDVQIIDGNKLISSLVNVNKKPKFYQKKSLLNVNILKKE